MTRQRKPRLDDVAARLLHWFDRHGRHDLPWQHPRTPYRVWLSEVMLQQTQVGVVIPYFERFVTALPDVASLAAAPQDQVLALWSGLGYYARARNLQAAAQRCVELHDGELPRDFDALLALPGIGRSTAGAILAQAWGDRFAILDGNVKRVLARLHGVEGWPGTPAVEKELWSLAEQHLPPDRLADYTQAQMDLGATICTRHRPTCAICPLQTDCMARIESRTDLLPTPRPGKAVPQREASVVWLQDDAGRVLMQRRPARGVWASLWSLPQFDDAAAAGEWLLRHHPGAEIKALAAIDHAFTHYRLRLHPLQARIAASSMHVRENEEHARWMTIADLADIGIPAPIRTLIKGKP